MHRQRDRIHGDRNHVRTGARGFERRGECVAARTLGVQADREAGDVSQLRDELARAMRLQDGGRVVEQLTFAPGLFRVEVTDQAKGDALDVANQLTDSGLVQFAEPELIEELGQRSS